MGLQKAALRLISREHKRKPFRDPVLILGRQFVDATVDEVNRILLAEHIKPAPLPAKRSTHTNIPQWAGTANALNVSDVTFFNLLGLKDVRAADYSDYEGADIKADLNLPVPNELRNHFGLVLDGGTLEHVFDVRQSLTNIALMLVSGGRVMHISPASNYVDHGFYQFSPCLFFDYYSSNRFEDLRGFLVEHGTDWSCPWELFELDADAAGRNRLITSGLRLEVVFLAEKAPESTAGRAPTQSFYSRLYKVSQQEPPLEPSVVSTVKRFIPSVVKYYLRRRGFVEQARKPWGLKYAGKLH